MTDQLFKPFIHHGVDLERAVIGICLLEKTAFGRTKGLVETECFYYEDHKRIYSVMEEMFSNSIPIDILTVSYHVVQKFGPQMDGGTPEYVSVRCTQDVVSSAHLEYHCHLIREMWRRREIVRLKSSYQASEYDTAESIRGINEQLNRITGGSVKHDWQDMSELIYDLMKHQAQMASGVKSFITTGFKKLDEKNGGFYNGQLIVLGARPSVGKSALMGKMAIEMAKKGIKVGIISLEMNNNEIAARLSSLETNIEFWKVFRTIAKDEDLHRSFYEKVSRDLIHLPIFLSDKTRVNATDIKAKAMKLKASRGCDCLMIDYLQLVDSEGSKNYNREQEVAKISRNMKLLAQEMEIPVIILCQLNRNVTSRSHKDRFPKLSDLRESGAIEQDADVVMFIHRDYMSGYEVDADGNSTLNNADLVVPKWRNGAPCHLELGFHPEKMNFYERSQPVLSGYRQITDYSEPQKDEEPF
jgi:replicative DNA helicase